MLCKHEDKTPAPLNSCECQVHLFMSVTSGLGEGWRQVDLWCSPNQKKMVIARQSERLSQKNNEKMIEEETQCSSSDSIDSFLGK